MTKRKKIRRYPQRNALKGLIRERGTSYRKLATEIQMTTNQLSNKINGYYDFTCSEVEKISEFLDINPIDVCRYFLPTYCETQHTA